MTLPRPIYRSGDVRRIDRAAIEVAGIAGYTLMCRAGEAAFLAARKAAPAAQRWQVVCGAGNNGGDGYVVARLARAADIDVSVTSLVDPGRLQGDAQRAWTEFVDAGGDVGPWTGELDQAAELLVDAVLGSGIDRPVEGNFRAAVEAINAHPAAVLSLDIPSGLDGDTGAVMGSAVEADLTVTFVGLKSGLFLGEGPDRVGQIHFADLDIPASCRENLAPAMRRIDDEAIAPARRRRRRGSHKGDFGHLLVVGGGPGMPGAVRLAGEAALRSGAGRVSIATHPGHAAVIAASRPELMCHALRGPQDLEPLLTAVTGVAIGPGLGTEDWGRGLWETVLQSALPVVADADALNLLARSPASRSGWILTPHPGEAGRLLGRSARQIQADRLAAVTELAARYGGTVVLKGAGTLVSSVNGAPWLCSAGNPGMAAPGMGDVLTGIIGGLMVQGLGPEEAAVAGVEAHARAGDRAAGHAPRGLLASELMAELRACLNTPD